MTLNNRENKPKKKNSAGAIIAAAVIGLLSVIGEVNETSNNPEMVIGFIVIIAVIIGIVFFIIAMVNSATKGGSGVVKSHMQRAVSWSRDSGETPITAPASRPKAYVYDDRAYERNAERDVQRRVAQLDDFLKNGIIEKEEYLILKARYQRNGK